MSHDPDSTPSLPPDPGRGADPQGQPTGEYTARPDPDDHTTPWARGRPAGEWPVGDLPGYELLGEISRGGMGVVLKARQVSVGRVVALKVISSGAAARPAELARFQVEAEAVAALQHPHVVQLFEYGQAGGLRFLALEYVPGGTLAARLRGRPFAPREAAALVARLAAAVHAAHAKGVLHRDLKPGNVLMTEAGEPKVTDFGLARVGASDLTADGQVMGTPNYMSPEQAAGDARAVGTRSDVWALGAILYELLTGAPPFRRDTVSAVIHAVIHEPPTPPRRLNRRVPRDLETICLKCLQKDPADRYPSADALAADLAAYLGGYPVEARPVGVVRRTWKWVRRHPVRAGVLMALFATGLAVGVLVPRVQPVQAVAEGSARVGTWVTRDRDTEQLLRDLGRKSVVFRTTGRAVRFWLELEKDGAPLLGRNVFADGDGPRWTKDDIDVTGGPDARVEGLFVWERGDRRKDGTEEWRLTEKYERKSSTRRGSKVANVIASVETTSSSSASRSQASSRTTTIPLWPAEPAPKQPPRAVGLKEFRFDKPALVTGEGEHSTIVNPIPADRPVRLLEVRGGMTADGAIVTDERRTAFQLRLMCQVVEDPPKP